MAHGGGGGAGKVDASTTSRSRTRSTRRRRCCSWPAPPASTSRKRRSRTARPARSSTSTSIVKLSDVIVTGVTARRQRRRRLGERQPDVRQGRGGVQGAEAGRLARRGDLLQVRPQGEQGRLVTEAIDVGVPLPIPRLRGWRRRHVPQCQRRRHGRSTAKRTTTSTRTRSTCWPGPGACRGRRRWAAAAPPARPRCASCGSSSGSTRRPPR